MLRVELAVQEVAGLLEVSDGGLAVSVAVLEDREHGMARRIAGTQPDQASEQRHRVATAGLIMQLRGTFQGRDVIGRELEGVFERREGVTAVVLPGQRDAFTRQQLGVVWR